MRRKLNILVMVAFGIFLISGCVFKYYIGNRPADQINTIWESEDKQIYFKVDEHGVGYGYLIINEKKINIEVATARGLLMYIYIDEGKKTIVVETDVNGKVIGSAEMRKEENQIEKWNCDFYKDDTFTATVDETTYFVNGQKIKFNRIE